MNLCRIVAGSLAALTFAFGCSKETESPRPAPPTPKSKPTPARSEANAVSTPSTTVQPSALVAEREDDPSKSPSNSSPSDATPSTEHGEALGWVPRDALFAVRVADLSSHRSKWQELAIAQAVQEFNVDVYIARFHELLELAREDMSPEETEIVDDLFAIGQRLEGDSAFAIFDLNPVAAMMGGVPVSAVFHIGLGDATADAIDVIDRIAIKVGEQVLRKVDDGFYRALDSDVRVDVSVRDERISLLITPATASDERLFELLALAPSDSFLAAEVVTSARIPSGDDTTWLEAFVNLDPIWPIARNMQPEIEEVFEATGLDALHGISYSSALAGPVFHDVFALHADGKNIVTSILTGTKIDPKWASYIPEGFDTSGLMALDLDHTFATVMDCIPSSERGDVKRNIDAMQHQMNIDLRRDILQNFGPHFVVATAGDMFGAMAATSDAEFQAALTIEVKDTRRAGELLDLMLEDMPFSRVPHFASTTRFYSVSLPMPDVPSWLEPSFGFTRNSFVFTTSPAVFESVITASENGGDPAFMQRVRSIEDAVSVSSRSTESQVLGMWNLFNDQVVPTLDPALFSELPLPSDDEMARFAAALPPVMESWQANELGITFDGFTPVGTSWVLALPLAVAIPNLMSARLEANEKAAISTLRSLASAQAQCASAGTIDRDGDGVGEYGFLGELAGSAPLPDGKPMSMPLIAPKFQRVDQGCVKRSGYLFRVYLPGEGARMLAERFSGGAPDGIDPNRAEQSFVIYAWPAELGATGNRVFVITEANQMLFTDNGYPNQYYGGYDSAPSADAACDEPGKPLTIEPSRPWREGQDGGFWMAL